MDTGAMIKGHISLQKQAFNNFMDAMAIFQDQAVRANRILADQIKIDEKAREFADQWRMALNKGRDDFRAQVNEAYARIEELYDGSRAKSAIKKARGLIKKAGEALKKVTAFNNA